MIVEIRGGRFDLTSEEIADLRRQLLIPDEEIDAEVAARDARADEEALIGTAEAARRIGMSREFVRDHASELGGRKLTPGPKGRWLFDPLTLRAPSPPAVEEKPAPPRRGRASVRPSGALLAIRGERP